jgi:hypothetical protein
MRTVVPRLKTQLNQTVFKPVVAFSSRRALSPSCSPSRFSARHPRPAGSQRGVAGAGAGVGEANRAARFPTALVPSILVGGQVGAPFPRCNASWLRLCRHRHPQGQPGAPSSRYRMLACVIRRRPKSSREPCHLAQKDALAGHVEAAQGRKRRMDVSLCIHGLMRKGTL